MRPRAGQLRRSTVRAQRVWQSARTDQKQRDSGDKRRARLGKKEKAQRRDGGSKGEENSLISLTLSDVFVSPFLIGDLLNRYVL